MKLRFLGKETQEGDSPTLYATDRGTYLVQGWKVHDIELRNRLNLPDSDDCVEIYTRLLSHLAKDGLHGTVDQEAPPIVAMTGSETCIISGMVVTDSEARNHMRIPDHEDCVEVAKETMKSLLRESTVGPDLG